MSEGNRAARSEAAGGGTRRPARGGTRWRAPAIATAAAAATAVCLALATAAEPWTTAAAPDAPGIEPVRSAAPSAGIAATVGWPPPGLAAEPSVLPGAGSHLAVRLAVPHLQPTRPSTVPHLDLETVADDAAALDALRAGRTAIALVCGTDPTDGDAVLAGEVVHELVLGFVVPPQTGVRALSGLELQRLLSGSTGSWDRLGGRHLPVHVAWSGRPEHRLALDRGPLRDRPLRGDRVDTLSPTRLAHRCESVPGTIGVVEISTWGGALPLPVDGVRPTLTAWRAGRYPFGLAVRVVYRRGDDGPVLELIRALRGAGSGT